MAINNQLKIYCVSLVSLILGADQEPEEEETVKKKRVRKSCVWWYVFVFSLLDGVPSRR